MSVQEVAVEKIIYSLKKDPLVQAIRKGGASGKAVNHRHTQPKTVFWGAFFEMLVTQNVKLSKEDLCNKPKPPLKIFTSVGGMLTVLQIPRVDMVNPL